MGYPLFLERTGILNGEILKCTFHSLFPVAKIKGKQTYITLYCVKHNYKTCYCGWWQLPNSILENSFKFKKNYAQNKIAFKHNIFSHIINKLTSFCL